jgi:hypothetical protein
MPGKNLNEFQSVRLGPESFLEALAHDHEHLDLKSCVVEIKDARLSEMGPDKSVTGGRASFSSETSDTLSCGVAPDAPRISAPAACGASTSFDGLPDIPKFLDRRRSAA